jgi:ferritin heavy chain
MSHQQSQVRQNFATQVEASINKQINIELYASYVYLSMVSIYRSLISKFPITYSRTTSTETMSLFITSPSG